MGRYLKERRSRSRFNTGGKKREERERKFSPST